MTWTDKFVSETTHGPFAQHDTIPSTPNLWQPNSKAFATFCNRRYRIIPKYFWALPRQAGLYAPEKPSDVARDRQKAAKWQLLRSHHHTIYHSNLSLTKLGSIITIHYPPSSSFLEKPMRFMRQAWWSLQDISVLEIVCEAEVPCSASLSHFDIFDILLKQGSMHFSAWLIHRYCEYSRHLVVFSNILVGCFF